MKTIVISNMKGGSGKSTLAINLSHAFGKDIKVALLDTDTQATSFNLAQGVFVTNQADNIPEDTQLLIVDTPPYISDNLSDMYNNADLVIVPMGTGFSDIQPTQSTLKILSKVMEHKKDLRALVVINGNDSRSQLGDDINTLLVDSGFDIARVKVENRISYKRSLIEDKGIYSLNDKKAIAEFNELAQEILAKLI